MTAADARNAVARIADGEEELDPQKKSEGELIALLLREKEKFKAEEQRRIQAEEELQRFKDRCEEREDMWLKALSQAK